MTALRATLERGIYGRQEIRAAISRNLSAKLRLRARWPKHEAKSLHEAVLAVSDRRFRLQLCGRIFSDGLPPSRQTAVETSRERYNRAKEMQTGNPALPFPAVEDLQGDHPQLLETMMFKLIVTKKRKEKEKEATEEKKAQLELDGKYLQHGATAAGGHKEACRDQTERSSILCRAHGAAVDDSRDEEDCFHQASAHLIMIA
eukprot:scaffold434_cov186-Pinguiococcus_pyrenoidosus.AAC.159